MPFEIESDQPEWILEQARLHRLCDGFGFTEWREGLWFLDLATTTLDTTRQQLHDRLSD